MVSVPNMPGHFSLSRCFCTWTGVRVGAVRTEWRAPMLFSMAMPCWHAAGRQQGKLAPRLPSLPAPQQRQCWMVGLRQPHRPRSPLGAACHRLSSAHHKEAALIVQQQAVQLGLHLCRQGTAGAASRLSRGRPDSRCRRQRLTALCDCKPCCRAGSSAPAPSWEGRQARVKHLPACLTRLSRDAQRQLGALNRRRDDL